MRHLLLVFAFLALTGCAPPDEAPPSSSTGDPPASTDTTDDALQPLHASFFPEVDAGNGPSLLRLFNETDDQILSLTMDDGREFAFYLVEPWAVSDYVITVSDDMLEDAILSIHTFDTCIRKPFAEITGPLALEPGHAYGIHVAVEDGFVAHIEEEAAPGPFMGVRAHVADPAGSSMPAPAQLVLSTAEAPSGEVIFDTIFTEHPEPYVLVPASKVEITKVRFVDRSGVAHESTSPFILEGAHGYTVHVAEEAKDGADLDFKLDTISH